MMLSSLSISLFYFFILICFFPIFSRRVIGMMCQKNCGTTVQRALESVPGVIRADVSFMKQRAIVWGSASASKLIGAIEAVGFDAEEGMVELTSEDECADRSDSQPDYILSIQGMKDSISCPIKINDLLLSIDGVLEVKVLTQ